MSSTQKVTNAQKNRARFAIIGIALLFIGPMLAAWWFYNGPGAGRPHASSTYGSSAYGSLIDPVRALPMASFLDVYGEETTNDILLGKWSLVFVSGSTCDEICRSTLDAVKDLHAVLGHDASRVQRVYFFQGDGSTSARTVTRADTQLIALRADIESGGEVLDVFPIINGTPVTRSNRIYLVDPVGNLMMSFPENADISRVLQDVQRLLKLSTIG